MVFHCRCLSFSLQEEEEEEEIEYETTTQVQSTKTKTKTQTFYTASSNFNPSVTVSQVNPSLFSNNLKEFTLSELKTATENFSPSSIIGAGGFGFVYIGVINNPQDSTKMVDVAVKRLNETGSQVSVVFYVLQGDKEWVTEVNVLGVVEHPNLVKLVGYCAQDGEWLLVYEYMPNGTVKDHLSTRSEAPLSWTRRLKVARDVACGLTYLHEQMDFQIIFRDLKSSNVLLDDQWDAKLSDFGLARRGPEDGDSHIITEAQGTRGYMAPESILTGYLTSKSDVWSYGVFLSELITGRHPLDWVPPQNNDDVLYRVQSFVDSESLELIIDPRLEGNYLLKSVQKLCSIAIKCLYKNPKFRPKMSTVLEMVNQLIVGVQSEATPLDSLASVVPTEANMVEKTSENMKNVEPKMVEKTSENMKSVGETGSTEIQRKGSGCFSCSIC
ncbi:hypothetical protein OSB04_014054 [Centaurea solstitialis]|uniref:Protein kinase domain-containing protein n=1 Tax=Centaurea solstitialis TaxID=347529 RepID=A0AA38TEE5_9ASTR|nr:hypothetical protein OSB04_014054 [Centaurea solstitialis]